MKKMLLLAPCLLLAAGCSSPQRGFSPATHSARPRAPAHADLRFVQQPMGTCQTEAIPPLREMPIGGQRDPDRVWL